MATEGVGPVELVMCDRCCAVFGRGWGYAKCRACGYDTSPLTAKVNGDGKVVFLVDSGPDKWKRKD